MHPGPRASDSALLQEFRINAGVNEQMACRNPTRALCPCHGDREMKNPSDSSS